MAVGGDDDTLASSLPTLEGGSTSLGPTTTELVNGRYRIVRFIGGGGMGRVYEALDTELDERVALKVLRAGLSDEALERFRREVKLTRRIQHRNVARMFDIGEYKGEKFLTMELVDGEPLSREIGETPMPWSRLEGLAQQICAGLAAAHAAGVIHRDLKPDNVLVERGTERAVLTDFGIARSGDDPGVTQVGAVVGTPRYMAPEQLNCREIDARADLFSLGVMLFELATGLRPWPGDNPIAIAVAQATTSPRTIDTTTGSIPGYFASIVSACLQLEASDRPATAGEVGAAIAEKRPPVTPRGSVTRIAATAAEASKPPRKVVPHEPAAATLAEPTSIAVLPFSCAPGDEYLADGVLDDLTDTLSTTPGLRVRPAGVVRQAALPDPREIGQRLVVDHVISGSLRRTPTGLRISTRLISVADGFQIWANKTDCAEAEVLSVSDELARGIAAALSSRATSNTKPTDPRAVDLYLRARAELRRFWGSHAEVAAQLLAQAVEIAPTSAPILGAYAYACVQTWVMRGEPELVARAESALSRALAAGHGEAYLASAQFQFNRGQQELAAADLGRALARAPMSAQTHELAGKILVEIDGTEVARRHFETARGLDPGRAQIIDSDLARIDALEGKWDDCERRLAVLVADPDQSIQQLGLVAKLRLRSWRAAPAEMIEASKAMFARASSAVASIFDVIGKVQQGGVIDPVMWKTLLAQRPGPGSPVRQYTMRMQIFTELALVIEDRDRALEALEATIAMGLTDLTWLNACPLMEKIREDRRFSPLRRQVEDRAARVLAAFRGAATGA
ncbi:MAG: protein kinase [Kofleriaceae bacterium]|nr:protein kinase [Kofleriaceae bacterium]